MRWGLLAGAMGWIYGSVAFGQTVDRIAAVVDDEVITLSEVYELGSDFIVGKCGAEGGEPECYREAEVEVLETLVKWALVRQQLKQLEMGVTGEEVFEHSGFGTIGITGFLGAMGGAYTLTIEAL